jgi:NAD(P)-dependent dehydrogenase (short-subunit alcohol dehydrogenase family)
MSNVLTTAGGIEVKVALVTGANKGLGLATAERLGNEGARVLVGARDAAKGEAAADVLRSRGIDAEALTLDVSDCESVRAAADEVRRRHGRLDILVNNAGILPEATAAEHADGPLDVGMFKDTFGTNVFGAVAVTQAFLPLLRAAGSASVVNVSSTMGSLSDQGDPESPYYGVVVPAYQASKAALNSMTIGLSKLLADTDIKVNSVCPGWVKTDLGGEDNKAAAPTAPDEAAEIVAELALVGADGPTGAFLDAAGPVAW